MSHFFKIVPNINRNKQNENNMYELSYVLSASEPDTMVAEVDAKAKWKIHNK